MLHVGSATTEITPDHRVQLAGYPFKLRTEVFRDGPRAEFATGVNDPLYATAIVVSDGDESVGLVSADLLNVNREITTAVREAVEGGPTGIDQVMLSATHTHSGPQIPALLRDLNPIYACEHDADETVKMVQEAFVDVLQRAAADTSPATVSVGCAHNDTTPVNRRRTHQDLADAEDIIDPELLVLFAEPESGSDVAVVNFACHPICLSASQSTVSADYPGVVRRHIREVLGDVRVLFVNGAAGDINPRDRNGKEHSYMEEIGTEVGETAVAAIEDAKANGDRLGGPVRARRRGIDMPLQELPDRAELRARERELSAEIDEMEADGIQLTDDARVEVGYERGYVQELLALYELGEGIRGEVQHFRIGNCGVVTQPGESFVKHGLELKEQAATGALFIAGYANTPCGYLPTLEEFEHEGYEVRSTKVAPAAIERLRETGLELVAGE